MASRELFSKGSIIVWRLWLSGALLCLLVLVLLLTAFGLFFSDAYHALLHEQLGIAASLRPHDSLQLLDTLHRYLGDSAAGLIQSPLFTNPERDHYLELKAVYQQAKWLVTSAALLLLMLGVVAWYMGRGVRELAKLLKAYAYTQATLVAVAVLVMASGFKDRFDGLHGLLFSQANWVFPKVSVSIQLFPLRYFIVSAWVWALILLLLALISFLAARYLERRVIGHGGTEPTEKTN